MRITTYQRPVLIYNPQAGKLQGNSESILHRTTQAVTRATGFLAQRPQLMPTVEAGHAKDLAQEAVADGADLVLALGGDGTINEVANGLALTQVPLGILPAGTANVLAMEIGLGSSLERAAARLAKSTPRRIALGKITANGSPARYFVLMAGIGLDAKIVQEVSPPLKEKIGKGAYWAAGLSQLPQRLEEFELRTNGTVHRSGFALASRVRNYGGDLEIATEASLLKDDFELVMFEGANPWRYLGYMMGVAAKQVKKMPGVHTIRTKCFEIVSSAHLQVDGEYAGQETARIEIAPDALTLLLPASYG
jgi:YegS/Rv2252/BmrU family lipid kinase